MTKGSEKRLVASVKLAYTFHVDEPTALPDLGESASESDRWRDLWHEAHELALAGKPEDALRIYECAADGAETAQDTEAHAAILHDAANAAVDAGHFARARSLYDRSATCAKCTSISDVRQMGTELERARIEILCGRPTTVFLVVDSCLATLRLTHEQCSEAPNVDPNFLTEVTQTLRVAWDSSRQLALLSRLLDMCLTCIEALEALPGAAEDDLARIRLARIDPLLEMAKHWKKRGDFAERDDLVAEVRETVEECIARFHQLGNDVDLARAYAAKSRIEDFCGARDKAIQCATRSLEIFPDIVEPWDRAILHDNLATYWHRLQQGSHAADHWLAALIIRLAADINMKPSINYLQAHRDYAKNINREAFAPCSVSELLEQREFLPLRRFVQSMNQPIPELQEALDRILRQAPRKPPNTPQNPSTPTAPLQLRLAIHAGTEVVQDEPPDEIARRGRGRIS